MTAFKRFDKASGEFVNCDCAWCRAERDYRPGMAESYGALWLRLAVVLVASGFFWLLGFAAIELWRVWR